MVWRIAVIGVVAVALLLSGCQLGFDKGDMSPAWSLDSTKIAFTRCDGNPEIYFMNADGSNQTNLTNNPAYEDDSAWSPDGTKIAFTRNCAGYRNSYLGEIYVMNADGSSQTNLTNNPYRDDSKPAWSPDGTRIAFVSSPWPGGLSRDIYVMNADGSNRTNLTRYAKPETVVVIKHGDVILTRVTFPQDDVTNDVDDECSPAWSLNGTKIAFARDDSIYVMNADGSNQTRVTDYPKSIWRAAWSPDLTKIAFTTLGGWRQGYISHDIYVMNADGSNQTNLTNSPDREGYLAWSRDGTKIAFAAASSLYFHIYTMDADGSNRTRLTGVRGWVFLVLGLVAVEIIVAAWWLIRRLHRTAS